MKYQEAIKLIEEIAPIEKYKDIDNSGVQISTGKEDIRKLMVCLEINKEVLEEAVSKKADMILTHHPLIFTAPYCIDNTDYPGYYIQEAIRNDISVYSAHLSFDFAAQGNNFFLAQLLDLLVKKQGSMEDGYYGMLPEPMSIEKAGKHVEECLELPKNYIRVVDGGKKELVKVGFCTGAGGDYIYKAASNDCDLFITGDLKLHEAQYAKARGMSVIDAGHYGTEKIFTQNFAHQLYVKSANKSLDLDVIMSKANTNPYTL